MKAMAELNLLERQGLRFLRGRVDRDEPRIHKWPDEELSEIQRMERWTIGVAALSGTVSGGLLGGLEIGVRWWMGADAEGDWWRQLPYWSVYLVLAVLVSGVEILFLYWSVLRTTARITSVAGLRLSEMEIEQATGGGLVRAALDLPNPRAPVFGIDPYARVPRWKLLAYTVLYRIKVGVTSFLLRVVLRRVLARAALRFFIPLMAIPVFAVWNAVITWWVLREVRIRAAGPVAVQELGKRISRKREALDERSRRAIIEAVGEAVVRSEDAHPNFVVLLERLFHELDVEPESINVDWESSREFWKDADREARAILLTTVTTATVLAGRPWGARRAFLTEAHEVCGRSLREEVLSGLYRDFISGRGFDEQRLKAVGGQSTA